MADKRYDDKRRRLMKGELQRNDGRYQYSYRDKQGKRHYIYANTLKELRDKENEVTKNILNGKKSAPATMTLNDVYAIWLNIKRGLKDNVLQNYKYMYEHFVKGSLGKVKLNDLKKSDIRVFYNKLHDNYHLKASTIDCIHTVIHQVLNIAVDDELITNNPADNALKELKKAHPEDKVKRLALTVAQQKLLEEYLSSHEQLQQWYWLITVMLWTGMRIGELAGLRWEDVDFDKGVIHITHTLVNYAKENGAGRSNVSAVNTPKTDAGYRTIPMHSKVMKALKARKEFLDDKGLRCTARVGKYTDFIFANKDGKPYNQSTVNKALKRIIRDCNDEVMESDGYSEKSVLLPNLSTHVLRHTYGTRLCEQGVNIKTIQAVLGHKDIETTMNIYVDALDELNSNEIAKFDEKLKNMEV